jgi:translation elongation factor P/translation initiation factor 5A
MVIRYERGFCRVVDADYHAGGGKLAGTVHAKLEELGGGAVIERRFRPTSGSTASNSSAPAGNTSTPTATSSTS